MKIQRVTDTRHETQTRYFLANGEWVDSESTNIRNVVNPTTGEVIAEVPLLTPKEVERGVNAA